jgi:hypothetical protein
VEPDSLNADPDPAFQGNPDPIWIQDFDDQKLKKKIIQKIQEKKKSLQPSKANIQNFKKRKFISLFLCL